MSYCSACGGKRGHLKGCPTQEGQAQDKGRKKGHSKGLLKGEKPHKCRTCGGSGMVKRFWSSKGKLHSEEKTCPDCKGTGEI